VNGNLLEMSTVQGIARKMSEALVSRLRGCPGYESAVDVLCGDFAKIIDDARHGRLTVDAESQEVALPAIESENHPAQAFGGTQ
jgi:hypothetical protein